MKKSLFLAILATVVGTVTAGPNERESAVGVGFALVVVEKCTGIAPAQEYIPRIRDGLTRAGMPDEDFRQGFADGAMRAEGMYRGRPPAKDCKEAKALKAVLDKSFH